MTSKESAEKFLALKLQKRRDQGAYRQLQLNAQDGLADFCSNDYLGFARTAFESSGNQTTSALGFDVVLGAGGSTGSRLISGNSQVAEQVEKQIADFHEAEAALIFNSGYDANLGVCSALPQRGDYILYDELVHASVRDGVRLSLARSFSFRHNNLTDLVRQLQQLKGRVWVFVESIYSMDGDSSPLDELSNLSEQYGFYLIVDEAHGFGVYGEYGEGLVQQLDLQSACFARVYTFGKALGCHGAAVVGSLTLKEYLINFARSFIYTTALPLDSYKRIGCAYSSLPKSQPQRLALKSLSTIFDKMVREFDLPLIAEGSQIKSLLFPGNDRVRALANQLQASGFDVRPILSPTVPLGRERLRICLHSFNTLDQVSALLSELRGIV